MRSASRGRPVLEPEGETLEREARRCCRRQHLLAVLQRQGTSRCRSARSCPSPCRRGRAAAPAARARHGSRPRATFGSQRMPPPRLLVAIEQGLLAGLEEQHLRLQPVGFEIVEHLHQILEVVPPAHIGDDRACSTPLPRWRKSSPDGRSSAAGGLSTQKEPPSSKAARSPPTCRPREVAGDADERDLGLRPLPHFPHLVLLSSSWMSRATLPGTPWTCFSSSSRLAVSSPSGEPEMLQQGALAGPGRCPPSSSRTGSGHRPVGGGPGWCSIANRCASPPHTPQYLRNLRVGCEVDRRRPPAMKTSS